MTIRPHLARPMSETADDDPDRDPATGRCDGVVIIVAFSDRPSQCLLSRDAGLPDADRLVERLTQALAPVGVRVERDIQRATRESGSSSSWISGGSGSANSAGSGF
ncbi:MAG: hypothetical protein HKP61_03960 [Dactylosporangium sp.]|nr:hypothetical protein [Dactylosporangium sp.]NNJ60106.1 hypothetical protein [Dactylosporangium sp.]